LSLPARKESATAGLRHAEWALQVLDKEFVLPIGKAKIQRPGKDLTIVTFSKMVRCLLMSTYLPDGQQACMIQGSGTQDIASGQVPCCCSSSLPAAFRRWALRSRQRSSWQPRALTARCGQTLPMQPVAYKRLMLAWVSKR
jgi:hypothetical protein